MVLVQSGHKLKTGQTFERGSSMGVGLDPKVTVDHRLDPETVSCFFTGKLFGFKRIFSSQLS